MDAQRRLRLLLSLPMMVGVCFAPAVSAQEPSALKENSQITAPDAAKITLQPGEILLLGQTQAVDNERQFSIATAFFTLPNGRSARVDSKNKAVLIDENTVFQRATGEPCDFSVIAAEEKVLVIGKDNGSGAPITARLIVCGEWKEPEIIIPAPSVAATVASAKATKPNKPHDADAAQIFALMSQAMQQADMAMRQMPAIPPSLPPARLNTPAKPSILSRLFGPKVSVPVCENLPFPPATARMTTEDIQGWLEQVAAANPHNTKLLRLAQSSEGRFVWALEIRPQGTPQENFQRLAIVCRQHGDEPETTAAGAELIHQLLTSPTPRTARVLSRTAVLVIPVANPDGASRKQRHNALGQDLNRDWGRGRTREVSAIMYELQRWQPQLVVDVHQWVPGDAHQTPMAEASGGSLSRKAASAMTAAARKNGYWLAYRSQGGGGTLCNRHYGGKGVPAILLETIHHPDSPNRRNIAIQTSVVALQRALDLLAG